jgi:signal transduction histidine kinase
MPGRLRRRFSSQRWRIILLFCATVVASIAAIWWYYLRQRDASERAFVDELTAIADEKAQQIANWRAERIGDGRVASSALLRVARRALAAKTATEADRVEILHVLGAYSASFSYASGTLVDLNGTVVVALNGEHADSSQLGSLARSAVKSGEVQLSDLYRDARSQRTLMSVAIPVERAGALILDIEASRFLFPYLESWPTVVRTGETYLTCWDGDYIRYLSKLRYHPQSDRPFRRPRAELNPVPTESELAAGWRGKGTDYRGVPALLMVRRIPNSPWYLSAKIDQSEVEAPSRRLAWEMALILVLISLASGGGVGLVWRNEQLEERIRTSGQIQDLNARLINAQEEERARLARELHDDISQQIAVASMAISNLKSDTLEQQSASRAQCDRVHRKLADLAESIRRLSHQLHPAVLEHAGLVSAVRGYCSEFREVTGVAVAIETEGSFDGLPRSIALCIYRIVQEALQNVAKHAEVTEATLRLKNSGGVVNLSIADRGTGIAPEQITHAKGLGLLSMRERARLVNGTVDIQSQPNHGTTVSVSIPVADLSQLPRT